MGHKLCALGLALLLASCGKPEGSDGYTFEKRSELIEPRPIVVQTYPSYANLKEAYEANPSGRKLGSTEQLFAFSVISPKVCTIHMIRPSVTYHPEEFGHELVHCLYGDFHPGQNDRS